MTKVLLVEDDAWLADLEVSVLSKEGYEVLHAPNALEAIAAVEEGSLPDVIVVDVLLAGSTGFALLHELQSYVDTTNIPVVLCTNLAEQFDGRDMSEYGIVRVVNKTTMKPSDLVAAVRSLTI